MVKSDKSNEAGFRKWIYDTIYIILADVKAGMFSCESNRGFLLVYRVFRQLPHYVFIGFRCRSNIFNCSLTRLPIHEIFSIANRMLALRLIQCVRLLYF